MRASLYRKVAVGLTASLVVAFGFAVPAAFANPPVTPGAPTGLTAENATGTSVGLYWTAPANQGTALPFMGYNIYMSTTSGGEANPPVNGNTLITAPGTMGAPVVVTGLSAGTTYYFTVQAVNAGGPSASSNEASATTTATAPGAPTAVTATAGVSAASPPVPNVTIAWTAPAATNGSALIGYYVVVYDVTTSTTLGSIGVAAPATSYTWASPTPGTTYSFTVEAVNGVGTGPASAASAAVTPDTSPQAPMLGAPSYPAGSEVQLGWTTPVNTGSAILGYNVYQGTTAGGEGSAPINGSVLIVPNDLVVTGLNDGSTYYFKVAAVNASGAGTQSNEQSATPTGPPGAATGVTAVAAYESATVSWTAPSNNGGATNPLTYNIEALVWNGTSWVNWTSFNGEPGPTFTFPTGSLNNGSLYQFVVTSQNSGVNNSGNGPASAPSNSVTPLVSAPSAPTGLGVTGTTTSSVSLEWNAPANSGDGTAPTYNVYVATTPGGENYTQPPANGATPITGQSTTINGLTNGTTYYFTVVAINALTPPANASTPSAEVFGIPGGAVPSAPTGVAAAASGTAGTAASVSFTAPASSGASAVVDYVVTPYIGAVAQPTTGGASSPIVVMGLTPGTTYTFTVTAYNAAGPSAASAASAPFTPSTTPGSPTGVGAVQLTINGPTTVNWAAPGNTGGAPIVGYGVTPVDVTTGNTQLPTVEFASTSTTQSISGLTNGNCYLFIITAANANGAGSNSAPGPNFPTGYCTSGAPQPPTNVLATAGNASVSLSWTAPANDGNLAIGAYVITPYIGTTAQTPITNLGNGTSTNITGLTNGTTYTFTVQAVNSGGDSAASAPSAAATPFGVVVSPPTAVTATAGNTAATVTWTAPANNGGSPITNNLINVYSAATAAGPFTLWENVATGSAATTYTVTGLTNGTFYEFAVAGVNVSGTGPYSANSNAVSPAATPNAPTGLGALAGNGNATLAWTAPAPQNPAVPIAGYNVFQGTAPGGESTTPVNGAVLIPASATTLQVNGLTNGTTYYFVIVAVSTGGVSSANSNEASTGPAGVPGATAAPTATAGNAQVTVKWTAPASDGGSAVLGYNVFVGTNTSGASNVPVNAGLVSGTQYTVVGLANGTQYFFTVAAVNAVGQGPQSFPVGATPSTVAGAPSNVTAVAGDNSATLTWSTPAFDGGSPITGYSVTPYVGGSAGTPQTFNSPAPVEIVTGLTNGTTYTFAVAAINANGTGANGFSNFVTPSASAVVPDAPTGLTATAGNGTVALSWTAPATAGVTGYDISWGTTSGGESPAAVTQGTTYTVSGLTNGTTYYFTVQAVNAVGKSAASNEASASPAASGTTTALTLSKSVIHFTAQASVTFRIRVTAQGPGPALASWVRVRVGSKVLCDAQVAANGAASCVLPARSLKVGKYSVTAWYTGNMSYTQSTSPAATLTITEP